MVQRYNAVTEDKSGDADVWVLLGKRYGDNCQMLCLAHAIAAACGAKVVAKQMAFGAFALPPVLFADGDLFGLTKLCRSMLAPPWPRMVISSGRSTVPAALWVRKQAGGAVRLVHVGRPWAPLSWFDLVITTAQYGLPERENVMRNVLPLGEPPVSRDGMAADCATMLAGLPHPWIAVAIGGSAAPYRFDITAAQRLAARANALARETGGSLLLLAGPRSPNAALSALYAGVEVPHRIFPWGQRLPHFSDIAPLADRIVVTGDSAAMMAEAALTGKPTEIFPLRYRPPLRYRLVQAVRERLSPESFSKLVAAGLITSLRNLSAYSDALKQAGLLNGGTLAVARRAEELRLAALRCANLLATSPVPERAFVSLSHLHGA